MMTLTLSNTKTQFNITSPNLLESRYSLCRCAGWYERSVALLWLWWAKWTCVCLGTSGSEDYTDRPDPKKKTHQPFKQACLSSSTSVCGFCFYRMQTAEYTTMTMTMFDAIYILVFFTPVMCVHVCVSLPSCCGAALFFVGTNHTPLNRPNYRTQWLVLLMTNIMATATLWVWLWRWQCRMFLYPVTQHRSRTVSINDKFRFRIVCVQPSL